MVGDDLPQSGGGAGAGAAGHEPRHARATCTARARRSPAWRGTRTSTIRCSAGGWRASRRRRCSAGARTTGWRRWSCAEAWRKEIPGAALRVFDDSGHVPHLEEPDAVAAAVDRVLRGPGGAAVKFYYFHLMPYTMEHDEPSSWVTLSNRHYDPGRRPHALSPVSRPAGVRRGARLGRHLRQRAPPELLRHDAEPQRDGGHAGAPHDAREDRHPRQRAAAAREPAAHRRGDRHARRRLGRPHHLRLRARASAPSTTRPR